VKNWRAQNEARSVKVTYYCEGTAFHKKNPIIFRKPVTSVNGVHFTEFESKQCPVADEYISH
jgi:hypothetical protein